MIIPSQRLTAAKSRKSKEGRDDEDGEGNTYCELALLPKRSEFKNSKLFRVCIDLRLSYISAAAPGWRLRSSYAEQV